MLKYQKAIKLCLILFHMLFFQNVVMAANIGYVYFSQQSYCDKYNAAEHDLVTMSPGVRPVNSVIDIPDGTVWYTSFDTILKINDDYKNFYKQKSNNCLTNVTGEASYYIYNKDPKCSILHLGLQKDKDYYEFYSKKIVIQDKVYHKAQVLGYVFFECGMQFVLVQSI